jgi:hypothetical protein
MVAMRHVSRIAKTFLTTDSFCKLRGTVAMETCRAPKAMSTEGGTPLRNLRPRRQVRGCGCILVQKVDATAGPCST